MQSVFKELQDSQERGEKRGRESGVPLSHRHDPHGCGEGGSDRAGQESQAGPQEGHQKIPENSCEACPRLSVPSKKAQKVRHRKAAVSEARQSALKKESEIQSRKVQFYHRISRESAVWCTLK